MPSSANDIIQLVAISVEKDSLKQQIEVRTPQAEIFAEKNSVSQTEFFSAGQSDLKPQLMFKVWNVEYNNEQELIHDGQTYVIYRTYLRSDEKVELYCEKRVGAT